MHIVLTATRARNIETIRFRVPSRPRIPILSNNQLLDRLREQSKDPDERSARSRQLTYCEKELARVLRNLDVSYRIMKR